MRGRGKGKEKKSETRDLLRQIIPKLKEEGQSVWSRNFEQKEMG